ncbi:MAG: hypothetical protein KDA24_01600 [Deltaproteobacteria bacterium]|nr:hypothetical protein [Deltaproteobacteria bacterium]
MKVLVVFHGMAPTAGRTVVGSGLRAFANGEALRAAGHEVIYCTRHEDLPEDLKTRSIRTAPGGPLLLTSVTGPVKPPGDRARRRTPATAALDAVLGPAPAAIGMAPDSADVMPPDWVPSSDGAWTPVVGLAPVGGPVGAPGNPLAFTEPHELQGAVAKVDPDVVLVESLEDARYIQDGRWTVILDLFAPRLLEQQFQAGAADTREAVRVLDALQRADNFLFSNERQKYFHLPLLALAGVDCTKDAGGVVPISCPPDSPPFVKPAELTFLAGGVFWPWADLTGGLQDLLGCLDVIGVGKVRLFGGRYGIRSDTEQYQDPTEALPKDHERLELAGMVPIDELWEQYRRGSVAFDLMAPNPERELNLSFRQVDYLRCGLPLITSPGQVIARDVEEYGAGWLVEPGDLKSLQRLVRKLATNPKLVGEASAAAQALARDRYAWTKTGAELIKAVERPVRRTHGETLFATLARTQADLWEEHEDARRLRTVAERQTTELDKKSEEVQAQDAKIRQLLGTVDRLTASLEEVSRFRTETVAYLQEEQDGSLREAAELQRELDRRDLDIKKRDTSLAKTKTTAAKLKKAVAELTKQNADLQARFEERDGDVLSLNESLRSLDDRLRSTRGELSSAKRELETRDGALAELTEQLEDAEAEALERSRKAEASARKALQASETRSRRSLDEEKERTRVLAETAAARLEDEQLRHGVTRESLARLENKVVSLERDLRKKREELASGAVHARRQLDEQVAEAAAEISRAQAAAEESLRRLLTRQARAEEVNARLATEVRAATSRASEAERTLAVERDRAAAELQKKSEEHARARRELAAELARSLSDRDAAHTESVRELEAIHAVNHRELKAQHGRELASSRVAHARELDERAAQAQRVFSRKEAEFGAERARLDAFREREVEKRDLALAEAERLRSALEGRFLNLLGRAKTEAQRALGAAEARLEAVAGERGQLSAELEEAAYVATSLKSELAKKERELGVAGAKLAEAQAERDAHQLRIGELTVQVEQKDYAVRSLSADADKKSRELDAAQSQRAGLQVALDDAAATLKELEAQRDAAQEDLATALAALDDEELTDDEPDSTPPAPPTAEA